MLGVDREHQPVEKAPALGGRPVEQPVHRRRQPDHAQMIGEGGRRGDRLAVDAAVARGAARPRRPAARCRCRAWQGRARLRLRPTTAQEPSPSAEGDVVERGAAQAAARAPETRSPRSGWSCRRRSARPARPGSRRRRSAPRGSCGNCVSVRRRMRAAVMCGISAIDARPRDKRRPDASTDCAIAGCRRRMRDRAALTPASASARRARPWRPCPGSASASRDRRA